MALWRRRVERSVPRDAVSEAEHVLRQAWQRESRHLAAVASSLSRRYRGWVVVRAVSVNAHTHTLQLHLATDPFPVTVMVTHIDPALLLQEWVLGPVVEVQLSPSGAWLHMTVRRQQRMFSFTALPSTIQ